MADRNVLVPAWSGTGCIIASLLAAWVAGGFASGDDVTGALRLQAIVIGVGLAASVAIDLQHGLRNIVRVDLVSLAALYFLTYVEFLFPQPAFNEVAVGRDVLGASSMVILGMGTLALARHLNYRVAMPAAADPTSVVMPPRQWLILLWVAAALAYAHMLIAVNFNVVEMIEAMLKARFSQPWQRGRLGDWKALVGELALFLYVIPPIYGILLAKRKEISGAAFALATLLAAFTLFQGFASGTRNVFAAYIAGMIGAYLLVLPKLTLQRAVVTGAIGLALLMASTKHMLAFRQIGLFDYIKYGPQGVFEEEQSFFVDANLLNLAMIRETVPALFEHTGLDLPYNALIRPIPRALWPGKPEGLKLSIEDAAGMEGLTLAVTFVGEAYLAGGAVAVMIAGLFFGGLGGVWNSHFRGRRTAFSQLVYVAGFFPAAISMRSLMAFTTAVLPILGLLAISYYLSGKSRGASKRQANHRRRVSPDRKDSRLPSLRIGPMVVGERSEADIVDFGPK